MNENIIKQFEALATQTKQEKGNSFRVRSYYKVIKILKSLDFEITHISQIKDIKDIGPGTLKRVQEILDSGKLSEIKLQDTNLNTLKDLERITGIGSVKAKKLFDNGLTLEKILSDYKSDSLKEGFTNHQLLGIKHFYALETRIPYKEISQIDKFLKKELKKISSEVELEICGSYRRKAKTSGDIDVLFYSTNETEQKEFLPNFLQHLNTIEFLVDHLTTLESETKYMGMCKYKSNPVRRIDIRYIPKNSLGAAKLYFTGSGDFNKNMRSYANSLGYTINEYGIYKLKADKSKGLKIKTRTEEDIFNVLKVEYVEPENRLPSYKFN
jgi:DNA polymerase beta